MIPARGSTGRYVAAVVFFFWAGFRIAAAGTVELASHGRARVPVVVCEGAIPAEITAGQELASYLARSTAASFEIRSETAWPSGAPAIYVGPTRFASEHGIDASSFGQEEWVVRTVGDSLVLAGGRPRGTLYAVYHLLEEQVGVRWWTPYDETVPARRRLSIADLDRRGRPAFAYRDVFGLDGPVVFRARNRLNGNDSGVPWEYGGRVAYGQSQSVHNFFFFVPPDRYFSEHPEFFSERGGLRYGGRSQLCLTNTDVHAIVRDEVLALAEGGERAASRLGVPPPKLFDVSQNDWGASCQCAACSAVTQREGSESGPLLELVNVVAGALREQHPTALLSTLAYRQTFRPPRSIRPLDNVVVRVSGYGKRDFSKPVVDPANATFRSTVEAWSRIAAHLWIWDYAVTYGNEAGMPLPSYRLYSPDLRFYRERGVEGVFVQHDYPVTGDLRDLKVWLLLKLLEDPARDWRALVREFVRGFYGAAATAIRDYLELLESAAARHPGYLDVDAAAVDYSFIDAEFVVVAHRLFDRAERAAAGDPVIAARVRNARISLDFATLARWKALTREHPTDTRARRSPTLPDRDAVERRFRERCFEQIDLRLPESAQAVARADVERLIDRARDEPPHD